MVRMPTGIWNAATRFQRCWAATSRETPTFTVSPQARANDYANKDSGRAATASDPLTGQRRLYCWELDPIRRG